MAAQEIEPVPLAILIAGFLSPLDITDIRGKLSGRTLPWMQTDYPKVVAKLRATQLRIDWCRFQYTQAGKADITLGAADVRAGLGDQQVAKLIIPIQTNDQIVVSCEGVDRRLPTGALCFIDHRKRHRVSNQDKRMMAIHLNLDVYGSDQLRQLIAAAAMSGRDAAAQA